MELNLKIWRQKSENMEGKLVDYHMDNVSSDMSFLEMLDSLNAKLELSDEEPIAFDHDCREGICGTCSLYINGQPHGPDRGTTTCQLHMRRFQSGDTIVVEPWRAKAFKVVKDLVVDRSAFDRIIQAGGFISVNTGCTVDANTIAIPKPNSDSAFDSAACIGCGACVAACKNASAMLFVSAKTTHLSSLPQGQPERYARVSKMVKTMDNEGFGNCTNEGECEAACPKEIKMENISRLNRDYIWSKIRSSVQSD